MAKYRKIDPRIWNDAKFRLMSDNGQLLFLFVLTHPHMTPLGAMRATMEGLAAEKGWSGKAFREAFAEASRHGLLIADEKACFVGVPNFLKYNQPESPNVVKSWIGSVDAIPECRAKDDLLSRVSHYLEGLSKAFPKAFAEAFPKALAHPSLNQEQEQEQKQEPKQEQEQNEEVAAKASTDTASIDPALIEFCEWWNRLHANDLVHSKVETDPPSKAVRKNWKSLKRNPEVREAIARREDIEAKLQAPSFANKASWLTAAKMLGGTNKDGEVIVVKLLDGGYENYQPTNGRVANTGTGVTYVEGVSQDAVF